MVDNPMTYLRALKDFLPSIIGSVAGGLIVAIILRREFWKVLISILTVVAFVYGIYGLAVWLPQTNFNLFPRFPEATIGITSLLAVLLLYYLIRYIWVGRLCWLVYRGVRIAVPKELFRQLAQEDSALRPEREGKVITLVAKAGNIQNAPED